MEHAISAAEANRVFSRLLRDVGAGASYVITSHGRPVARIVPYDAMDDARADARARLRERLDRQAATDIGPWQRDEFYDCRRTCTPGSVGVV